MGRADNHPVTINKEAKFDTNELFFSITDKESTILSGNDLFVRISGYAKSELIGQYHNLIRHPDMPRIIFKTFWEYLNAGKPIVAYVKNRTKEGGFYWVLGAVFPLKDTFVSIRIKPSSALFTAAKELYFKLLMAESMGGMEESALLFPKLLSDLGFESYDHFMSGALLQELEGRKGVKRNFAPDRILTAQGVSSLHRRLLVAYGYSEKLMNEYDRWFEKIDMFVQVKTTFAEKGHLMRNLARDIVFLSLNASVSSYKVENGGETFGVLAHNIRTAAKVNDVLIGEIHTVVNDLTDALNEMVFTVAGMRIQIEMVTYFIEETVSNEDETEISELSRNLCTLVALVWEYTQQSRRLRQKLNEKNREIVECLDTLEKQIMYLGYIQTYGIIEAAGTQDESARFGVIFSQLKTLIRDTSEEVEAMQKMGREFYAENHAMMEKSHEIDRLLDRFSEEVTMIKPMEG